MKISLLEQREPFRTIFAATARQFLAARYERPFEVEWQSGGNWLENAHLNAIHARDASASVRRAVRDRYGASPRRLEAVLRRSYVRAASATLGAPLLATGSVRIEPNPSGHEALLFRGGLHRIRLFDYATGLVHVIPKSGAPASSIHRELAIRRALPRDIPQPALRPDQAVAPGFCEVALDAVPIDQIGDPGLRARAREKAAFQMGRVVAASATEQRLDAYLMRRRNEMASTLARRADVPVDIRQRLDATIDQLTSQILPIGGSIPVAISHGDPQDDNLLWTGETVVLTDWEFADHRHAPYDLLHTIAAAHTPGAGRRLAAWVSVPDAAAGLTWLHVASALDLPLAEVRWRRAAAALFLLEKLGCHAESAGSPLLREFGHEVAAFLEEIQAFMREARS
jgi:hypothetical protein